MPVKRPLKSRGRSVARRMCRTDARPFHPRTARPVEREATFEVGSLHHVDTLREGLECTREPTRAGFVP